MEKGYLDIHNINTEGKLCFLYFPDGTNRMIDAGDFDNEALTKDMRRVFSAGFFLIAVTASTSIVNYLTNLLEGKTQNRLFFRY